MQTKNMVVVRTRDGRVVKGFTFDFAPTKNTFHVADAEDESKVSKVFFSDLKAIFYVKTFNGVPGRPSPKRLTRKDLADVPGLKLEITFHDGEILFATTNGYSPGRRGFFVLPVDKNSNNERIFVNAGAVKKVDSWR
jgi:hypothetical protein